MRLESLVAEIRHGGFEATAVRADINDEQDVIRIVERTVAIYGRIDVAFNNAGTEGAFSPFIDQTNETYDTIFNANVRGVFWSMKHEAKAMLAQGSGTIINNASMGGVIGFANAALYIASKHAVLGLTKTASIEWFRQGVRVNAICPGLIDTPSRTASGRPARRRTSSVPPLSRAGCRRCRGMAGSSRSSLRTTRPSYRDTAFSPMPATSSRNRHAARTRAECRTN